MPGSIRMNPTKSPADARSNPCISVYYTAQTSSAVRFMAYPTDVGRFAGSYTIHGLEATLALTVPYFALVGVRQRTYSARPSVIVQME